MPVAGRVGRTEIVVARARVARISSSRSAEARMSCASTCPFGPRRAASWRVLPPAPAQASSQRPPGAMPADSKMSWEPRSWTSQSPCVQASDLVTSASARTSRAPERMGERRVGHCLVLNSVTTRAASFACTRSQSGARVCNVSRLGTTAASAQWRVSQAGSKVSGLAPRWLALADTAAGHTGQSPQSAAR